jgi:hypothetical protein
MLTTDATLANAITGQKDDILTAIGRATDAAELERSDQMIRFVAEVWQASGYGYKLAELRQRVLDRAKELIAVERAYLAGCRKNDRTRAGTLANIGKLESLLAV